MKELWKEIEGFDGKYLISNTGKILSRVKEEPRLRKTCLNQAGYEVFTHNRKYYLVHRLVAKHFIPNPQNLPEVNHKDENKLNNCAENLEWCSREYNCNYGTKNERIWLTRRLNGNVTGPKKSYDKQLKDELKEKHEKYIKEHKYSASCVKTGDISFFGKLDEMSEFFGVTNGYISRLLDTDRPVRGYYVRHETVV